ncbi:MAG: plastocyanin [Candidatus Aldehydirespiratoraceae bacterium]|jgi:plastocyanin
MAPSKLVWRRLVRKPFLILGVVAALVAAACAGSDTSSSTPSTAVSDTATPTTEAADATTTTAATEETTTTVDPAEAQTIEQINAYIEQAASFDQAAADAQFPRGLTFAAGGAPGYTRYVFRDTSAGVVPTLVEGPIDNTVRCQDPALPCSYLELKELHESGAEIPEELQITADELKMLVGQLDELSAFAVAHQDINQACAEGFTSDRIQTANMGTHLYKGEFIADGFNPSEPEILLYALADDTVPSGPVGQCRNGVWDGEPMQLIGTSFIIPPQIIGNEHPETFAGPLDNWHIHYNLCRGATDGRDSFLPINECREAGGRFSASLGWMIHAWVDPAHDNDLGVFSMWNSTVAPISDPRTIAASRAVQGDDFPEGAEQSLITDFAYSGELNVKTGQPLFFNNVDAVPHTVSAGTFENPLLGNFDSGLLSPGTNFELSFDEPGVYSLFCTLHPEMVATVNVEDAPTPE